MPAGSFNLRLADLQAAVGGLVDLAGDAGEGEAPRRGLAGAAAALDGSPLAGLDGLAADLGGQMSGILGLETEAALGDSAGIFNALKLQAGAAPTAALTGFGERVAAAEDALQGGLFARLDEQIGTLRGLEERVPANRGAILGALVEQILAVLASMSGPEADRIRLWAQSVRVLHRSLMPLIAEAQASGDPAASVVRVFGRALDSVLEVFGFAEAGRFVDVVRTLPERALPAAVADAAGANLRTTCDGYAALLAQTGADVPQFRDAAVAVEAQLVALKRSLRPVSGGMRRAARLPILQPGGLEAYLRPRLQDALSVKVNDVQKIDDPFNALLDRIDAAIEGIDLSSVRHDVLGYFTETRAALEAADLPNLGQSLDEHLGPVRSTIEEIESGVSGLIADIESFFDDVQAQLRGTASQVGRFEADGTFRFAIEEELRATFAEAHRAIAGDPENPGAPSLTGTLDGIRTSLDDSLQEVASLLDPVQTEIGAARDAAVDGINDFSGFVRDLDLPGMVDQLSGEIEATLDRLGPVDFDVVVDPVVAELEENTQKLRDIDPSSLNDLLRSALAEALDVVIDIDFTSEIGDPLIEQLDTVKAAPADALVQMQRRYEEGIASLDKVSPAKLIEPLAQPFAVVDDAVSGIDLATLLQPLDTTYEDLLVAPLEGLRPSALLEPVAQAQDDALAAFDGIEGAALVEPLQAQLDSLKARIDELDVTGWIDELRTRLETIEADLRAVRPSELLQPLTEDFARLESELDRFKPSVLLAPAAELAAPLLTFLEEVQQETVTALHDMFEAPLDILDQLQPETLTGTLEEKLDALIATIRGVEIPACYNDMRARFADLIAALPPDSVQRSIAEQLLDPEEHLGRIVTVHNDLLAALEGLKSNLSAEGLEPLYDELRERLLAMLPPYARELLEPETFKRVMRLADPTRFLEELDARFEAIKAKLVPIRPQDIAAELDASYDSVLALLDGIDIEGSLDQIRTTLERIKEIGGRLRVDFVGADIDAAVGDARAVVAALDIRRFFADLDQLHDELAQVVADVRPSSVLAGSEATLDQVKSTLDLIDPRATLEPPLASAWADVQSQLEGIDFTTILEPLVARLEELEAAFVAALERTETAFDAMLAAARHSLGGASAGASAGGSVG